MNNLFLLEEIHPIELRPKKTILSLTRRAQESEYLLYERLVFPSCGHLRQLKSKHPFVPGALQLLNDFAQSGISETQVADCKWNMESWKNTSDSIYSLQTSIHFHLESFTNSHGPGLIAFKLTLSCSVQQSTNGVWHGSYCCW